MTTRVAFDPQAGTLRRYERGVSNPMNRRAICTVVAKYEPWADLPPNDRIIAAAEVEEFRVPKPVPVPTTQEVA